MEMHVCCPKRWAKAQEKACMINDASLNRCIARLITMTLPRQWEIEDWQKRLDMCTEKLHKAHTLQKFLEERYVDDSRQVRYAKKVVQLFAGKRFEIQSVLTVLESGGKMKAYLYADGDLDFYFVIRHDDGRMFMNGGIIWHNGHWEMHT